MGGSVAAARDDFIRRNSRDGLFLRYARGRVQSFAIRQSMTLIGAAVIGLLGSGWMAPASLVLALGGEAADCLLLRMILRRWEDAVPERLRRLAALTAAVQALTIATCVQICWQFIPLIEARFFAAVFLMAAVTNAGLVRHHFPEGGRMRLGIYGLAAAAMLVELLPGLGRGGLFLILSLMLLGYSALLFIRAVEKGYRERYRFERALLDEQLALSLSQQALAASARQSQRLALVAQHASDSVIFTGADGRIDWVNAAFSRITGYRFDEAVGCLPSDLLDAPETSQADLARLRAAKAEGRPIRLELLNRTKDGRRIWMDSSMSPVFDAQGRPELFIALERDVTEARAHAAELAAARAAAEAAAQAKSQFLATMSHEIRTPLNGVIGVAELLGDTPLGVQQRQYVDTIVESGQALLTIINDVLDLSKLQAGKADLLAEPLSVPEVIAGAVKLIRPSAQKKGLALSFAAAPDFPRHLGDAGRLRQILLNLLGNAVKFTETGGVEIGLAREAGASGDLLRIAIADTGIGIRPERIATVFDSFTQADSTISRRFGGTGLGLTISRMLARQMGGDITLRSEPGQGAVFTVLLRLRRCAPGTVAAASEPAAEAPRTGLTVLLAEDNRTNLLIARKLLERSVALVVEATNGREAVERYIAAPPDLVLMDISMPEMDGMQATRAIRAHEARLGLPACPIHALTAFSDGDHAEALIAAGMNGRLAKPIRRGDLYALLSRIASRAPPALAGFDPGPGDDVSMGQREAPDGRYRHAGSQSQLEDRPDRAVADRHGFLQAVDVPVDLSQPAGHERGVQPDQSHEIGAAGRSDRRRGIAGTA